MDLRDSVNCVETCLTPVRKSDGGPTIWIGSHSGKVVSLSISVPSSADRNSIPLICAPTGLLFYGVQTNTIRKNCESNIVSKNTQQNFGQRIRDIRNNIYLYQNRSKKVNE